MTKLMLAKAIGFFFNMSAFLSKPKTAQLVLQLFCTPLSGKYSSKDLRFLDTATKSYFKSDDEEIICFHWKGRGRTVLFVHGWESNSARWKPYIDYLKKKDLNIITIDAPGHGLSSGKIITIPRYAAAIQKVAIHFQPDILVGHSLGGMACSHYISNWSNKISDLVLLSTPSPLIDMMDRYFQMLGLRKDLLHPLTKLFRDEFDTSLETYSTGNNLQNQSLNGIIVHDKHDNVTPYSESLHISDFWSNSRHISTYGLGHSLKDQRIVHSICDYISEQIIPQPIHK